MLQYVFGYANVKLYDLDEMQIICIGRGNVISKNDIRETPGNFPVYSSSQTNNGEIGRYGKYMFDDERITWSIDGGGKFFYRNNLKYSVTNVCGWIKNLNNKLLFTKYLFYTLENQWSSKEFNYTKKAHPSVIKKEYSISLPALPIQEKIVNILDNFEKICSDLQIGLPAEIEARKKQYEYYRDKLLSFNMR